ncbi:imelysin family protein [Devosia ureilytica]|nr:imelysin family protein [Devosia ureilytica]
MALKQAQAEFGEMVESWGRLSVLRFGPLISDNRFETIFFWPDLRGVTLAVTEAAWDNHLRQV